MPAGNFVGKPEFIIVVNITTDKSGTIIVRNKSAGLWTKNPTSLRAIILMRRKTDGLATVFFVAEIVFWLVPSISFLL